MKRRRRAELLAPYINDSNNQALGNNKLGTGADEDGKGHGREDGGDRAWAELGDRHPDFEYTI